MEPLPKLITFDIFGTLIDWRTGLISDLRRHGISATAADFQAIVDWQGKEEQSCFRSYADIVAESLRAVLGVPRVIALEVGSRAGRWPLYEDSEPAMRSLRRVTACAAMTNSDREHGEQVQSQLGFRLDHWFSAEEIGCYKPNPQFWKAVAERLKVSTRRDWWHCAAYADYDLKVAKSLGITTVFIERPHRHEGPADYRFGDLETFANTLKIEFAG